MGHLVTTLLYKLFFLTTLCTPTSGIMLALGGTVILVAKSLVEQADWVDHDPWVTGRVQEVRLSLLGSVLSIINVHIEPAASHDVKGGIIQQIACRKVLPDDGLQLVGGDWNFMSRYKAPLPC